MVISLFFPHKSAAEVKLEKGITFSLSTLIDGVFSFPVSLSFCVGCLDKWLAGEMSKIRQY